MDLRPDPQPAGTAGRISSVNGSGPPGDAKAATILAECRKQRIRALRWAAVSGALVVAIAAATVLAAIHGSFRGAIVFLIPVVGVINLMRLAQCLLALSKIRSAERLVRAAQEGARRTVKGD